MNENQRDIGKRLRYPDDLLKPIAADDPKNVLAPILEVVGLSPSAVWYEQEINRKLSLLLDHYKIARHSHTAFNKLVRRVAMDWIPGFEFVEKAERRGRKAEQEESIFVAEEVKHIRENNPTMKLGAACKEFQKKQDKKLRRLSSRSIERKYRHGQELIKSQERFLDWLEKRKSRPSS